MTSCLRRAPRATPGAAAGLRHERRAAARGGVWAHEGTNDVARRTREEPHRRRGHRPARTGRHALRRFHRAAPARRARRRGRRSHRHRPSAARARPTGARPVSPLVYDGRRDPRRRRRPRRRRTVSLLTERLRRQDPRLSHRRAPAQHAPGPAGVHRPHGRVAAARPHVDPGQRHRRPSRPPRARRVLHDAHRDVAPCDVRRLPGRGRYRPADRRDPLGRLRPLSRTAALLDGLHRGLAAAGRRPRPRRPRRPGGSRRARRGLLHDDRRQRPHP